MAGPHPQTLVMGRETVTSRAGTVLTLVPPDSGTVPGDTCPKSPFAAASRTCVLDVVGWASRGQKPF